MLETVPFYLNCRGRLGAGGLLAANLLTRRRSVWPVVRRLREAFEDRVKVLPPCGAGNTVAIASADEDLLLDPQALRAPAARLARQTGLDLSSTLDRLA